MCPKDANGMANSFDPDQTAPLGSGWIRVTLFAPVCLNTLNFNGTLLRNNYHTADYCYTQSSR